MLGVNKFKKNKYLSCISEFITPSHEAFVLLVLENNQKKWTQMGRNKYFKGRSLVPTLYTKTAPSGSDDKKNPSAGLSGRTQKARGWSPDAYRRYNKLQELVKKDRACHSYTELELMDHWRAERNEYEAIHGRKSTRRKDLDEVVDIDDEDISDDEAEKKRKMEEEANIGSMNSDQDVDQDDEEMHPDSDEDDA